MLLFVFLYQLAEIVSFSIVLLQFILVLVTGNKNKALLTLSKNLAVYIHQIIDFLSFNSTQQPYPFTHWPDSSSSSV